MLTEAEIKGMVAGLRNGDLSALVGLMGAIESDESGLPFDKTVKIQQRVETAITDVYYALTDILHTDVDGKEQLRHQLEMARARLNPSYQRFIKSVVNQFHDDINMGRINTPGQLQSAVYNYLEYSCEWVENLDKEIITLLCSNSTRDVIEKTRQEVDDFDGPAAMHAIVLSAVREDVLGNFSDWMEKVG